MSRTLMPDKGRSLVCPEAALDLQSLDTDSDRRAVTDCRTIRTRVRDSIVMACSLLASRYRAAVASRVWKTERISSGCDEV